jgi:TolB-like protein/Flp pilus assembly protein TadD
MIYRFADYTLDTDRRELRRSGVPCALEPQVFDLLAYLIQSRDRVVSRDTLLDAIWHGRNVSEATLTTRINAARRAIGDNGTEQRLIRTIRNRGFRFLGTVEEVKTRGTGPSRVLEDDRRLALIDRPRVAVLPFANISGDRRQEPFADGVTEELITALSKTNWLYVASRASSFALKGRVIGTRQIARRLAVRYVLGGSIRAVAGRARIAVKLADGLLDHHIWAEQYDCDIKNPFAVQEEICAKVMAAIEPQLYVAERLRAEHKSPKNLNAWECIVRALALMNARGQENAGKAHDLLQRAISLESQSAQAHSLLSMITTFHIHMGWTNRRQDAVPRALSLARRAISLNPYDPWSHAALGYVLIWKRPDEAILPCRHAIALNSNLAVGHYFLAIASAKTHHSDQVFPHADAAERLAQRDLLARAYTDAHNNVRATSSFALGRYYEGIKFARSAIFDNPSSPTAYRALIMNLAAAGQVEDAKRALQTLRRLMPQISQDWIKQNAVWASTDTLKRYVEAFRAAGLK